MDIIPDKRKLIGLVDLAVEGKICLPDFQRDFVWTRDAIADLIRSILRGYFVGSLLLLRTDPDKPPFAPVALRGAEPTSMPLRPEHLVLDGQQRLTSLLYALTAPDLGLKNSKRPRRYYVDLDLLLADADDDDIVVSRTEPEARREGLDTRVGQWSSHMLPLTDLLRETQFMEWRDGIDDWLHENDPEGQATFRSEWRPAWTAAITRFQSFEVPVVELPRVREDDDDSIARVCAIFEKLNSTGVELSVYDLLTARLFRSRINLHELWAEAVEKYPRIAAWSGGSADSHKFGVLMLRTLALLRNQEVKPKVLINLAPTDFVEDWERAAEAMDRALRLAEYVGDDGFGAFNRKWLPGYGLLPVLGALRQRIEEENLGADARADVRRWYWCSVFLNRYSSAVETKSRRDFVEFTRRWDGEDVNPIVFTDAGARIGSPGYSIRESASNASAVYSGVFCLLAIGGARDWSSVEEIPLQRLEDHHIFPRSYLNKRAPGSRKDNVSINTIVNRTLISNKTNRRISDSPPADYLLDREVFPQATSEVLALHFIGDDARAQMELAVGDVSQDELAEVYDKFRDAREHQIIEEVRRVCGVAVAAPSTDVDDDLEVDVAASDD